LEDRNGDGLTLTPMMSALPNPCGTPVYRLMDTGVNLSTGTLVYFGGPPVQDIGEIFDADAAKSDARI